jgi:hypothetical protein
LQWAAVGAKSEVAMLMQDTLHDLGCADTAASFDDALE